MFLFPALLLVCCSCSTDKAEPAKKDMPAVESEPIAKAEPVDKRVEPVDQGATITALMKAYDNARSEYRKASAAAESEEEKQKLKRFSIDDYSADMVAAIEYDVESAEAFRGLRWLYDKTKRKDDAKGKQATENYLALMMKHHYAKERIGSVADWIGHADNSQQTEQHLLKILANNKHEVDLANTVLAMINHYQAIKEIQTDSVTRGYAEEDLGEEGMKYVDSRSLEELNLLIDKYFEIGIQKYGQVQVWRKPFAETLAPFHFEHTHLQIGMQAPDIIGEDIDGVEFKLSDYKGKVVMLDFWGDWWGPCRAMYPHERSLIKQLKDESFALIGVNTDRDRDEIKRIKAEKNLDWRNFWDGSRGPISTKWNISGWPTLFVIDAKGVIRHKGPDVDAIIEKCLAEIGSDVKIDADHEWFEHVNVVHFLKTITASNHPSLMRIHWPQGVKIRLTGVLTWAINSNVK